MEREEAIEIARKLYNKSLFLKKDKEAMATLIPELAESEDERIKKEIIAYFKSDWAKEEGITRPDWIAWLEKQGVQKSLDKVEPKFHEGEWVTDGTSVFQIVKIENEWYIADDGERVCFDVVHQYYHLWTIQDAKVGDILFQDLMSGKTFIFNGINPEMAILYSFIINNDGEDVLPYDIGKPNTGIGDIEENKNIIFPATKEQCDLLFQKMHDAGYEWDDEKKEPKKIEQTYTNNQFTPEQASVLDRHIDKFLEEKPTWSEEDEKMIDDIAIYLSRYSNYISKMHEGNAAKIHKAADWIKSFKYKVHLQNKWKPSDEQMKALKTAKDSSFDLNFKTKDILKSLYNDLKKLL